MDNAHDLDLKLSVMGGLFVMALGASALPFVVSKHVKNTVVVFSVMNCLSGGVVLGAALSHMMPSADENFESYFSTNSSPLSSYPLTPAITAAGLILLLCIDRLFLGSHSHSEVKAHSSQKYTKPKSPHSSHGHSSHGQKISNYNTASPSPFLSSPTSYPTGSYPTPSAYSPAPYYTANSPGPSEPLLQFPHDEDTKIDIGFNTDHLNQNILEINEEHKSAVAKAWVFLLALSVHSVLEGLGMGAENNQDAFYSVLFAVLAHKSLEAFALGLSIFYARFRLLVSISMIVGYSLATPIGVLIGIIASSLSGIQSLLAGILVSLASGSFLYISLIEILPTELHKPHKMIVKLGAMIFGWIAMVILAYYA